MKNHLFAFTFLVSLTFGAAFGQPDLPELSEDLGRLVFPLDGCADYMGVYSIMQADEADQRERRILNQRVNEYIESGTMNSGQLHVISRLPGGIVERFPGRSELMYIRLSDVETDIQRWLSDASLSFILNAAIAQSLTYEMIEAMRDQLIELRRILNEDAPFNRLRELGDYAMDNDFTESEYQRMNRFFLGYVYFVEHVLRAWQAAALGVGGADALLEGNLWGQDLRSTIGFRFYAFERVDPAGVMEATQRSFEEVDRRMQAVDRGPIHALIALVLMNRQLSGMYGLWRELRDDLAEFGPLGQYNERAQAFVLRHLGIMDRLLLPEEVLPINGWPRHSQEAINRAILALHLKLRNLMVQLFAYANQRACRERDWEVFLAACEDVERYVRQCFGYVEPLPMEDPEADGYESGEWDEDAIMEEDPAATYRHLHGSDDEDSEYSDDEGEIDYPDEDEGNRSDYYEYDAGGERQRVETRFVPWITQEDLDAAIRASARSLT